MEFLTQIHIKCLKTKKICSCLNVTKFYFSFCDIINKNSARGTTDLGY